MKARHLTIPTTASSPQANSPATASVAHQGQEQSALQIPGPRLLTDLKIFNADEAVVQNRSWNMMGIESMSTNECRAVAKTDIRAGGSQLTIERRGIELGGLWQIRTWRGILRRIFEGLTRYFGGHVGRTQTLVREDRSLERDTKGIRNYSS